MYKRVLLSLSLFIVTLTVNAQIRLGVKGGVDITEMSFNNDVLKTDNRLGWYVGPIVKFSLPLPGLGMDVAAMYNQRESKIDLYNPTTNDKVDALKTKQVIVPVNVRYTIGLGEAVDVFGFAGPQLAFRLGDEEQNLTDDSDAVWRVKNSTFSVNVGVGVTLDHFQLSANYNVGVGKTGDVTWKKATDAAAEGWKGNYNSWQISAAIFF